MCPRTSCPIRSASFLCRSHKLGQKDFIEPFLKELFVELKGYLTSRKRKFEIKYFVKKFDGEQSEKVMEIFLRDIPLMADVSGGLADL